MLKLLMVFAVAFALVASPGPMLAPQDAVAPAAREPPGLSGPEQLAALGWLAGEWRGRAGDQDVVSWHSDPEGGMIVMATKELKDGKLTLFDFGVISARETAVGYVPYPYGKPSVAFVLTDFDPAVKRALFANDDHDFPKRFLWERIGERTLRITLTGDERGEPLEITYELSLAGPPSTDAGR